MNVTLPESWKEFIDGEVKEGGYGDPASYLQALLEEAQRKRKVREKIEAMLEEDLNSGEPTPWTRQDLENIKKEIHEHYLHAWLVEAQKRPEVRDKIEAMLEEGL